MLYVEIDLFWECFTSRKSITLKLGSTPQYVRQILTSMKEEINSNTIIVGEFNTPLTTMDRSTKQKINKETQTFFCLFSITGSSK